MKNLIQTAMDTGNFKILINAVQEAGLIDALSQDGPFTIFAPDDKAFSKLTKEDLEFLFYDKEKLTEILTYHIIADNVTAEDVKKIKKAVTINGKKLSVNKGRVLKINNSKIIKTNIVCSNGIIHIIDEVLIPN